MPLGIGLSLGVGRRVLSTAEPPPLLTLTAPVLFLDAAAIVGVADVGTVTTWPDRSGNGNSPTQATSTKRPVWSATGGPNGRPCVTFDGVDDYLRITFTWNQPAHIWVVAKCTTDPGA